jgi:ADP-ribose pyrophosphatase YjhB (NUDIX family)
MITFCPQCATRVEQRPFEGKLRPTCPGCGYIAFIDPKVAATVLIERDGRLLLIRRAIDPGRGQWCFPGGYVDFGEDPASAAVRECREETGLEVDQVTLLDVSFNGRVIVITYAAQADAASEPRAADDADGVGWFPPDALPPLAFDSMTRPIAVWSGMNGDR